MKEYLLAFLASMMSFVAPVQPFFLLISLMVSWEFFIKYSIDAQKASTFDSVVKLVGFLFLIFIALVADDAFHFKTSNLARFADMGFPKDISPLAYLISVALVVHQFRDLEKVYKRKFKRSLMDTITKVIPNLLEYFGYKKAEKK